MTCRFLSPILAVSLVAGALAAGCDVKVDESGGLSLDVAKGKATDTWERTYTVAPGGRLEIVNVNGPIEAFAAKGAAVEVHARREVQAGSDDVARELLGKIQMLEEVAPDRVRIATLAEFAGGVEGRLGGRARLAVEYRIGIPPGLDVSLRTQNGPVRIDGVEGRIQAASTNGNVTGRAISGSLTATTVNGSIEADVASVTADMQMTTVNGRVNVMVAPTAAATIEAGAINGGVEVDESLPFTASERERGRVAGRLNGGGPRIVARTTNGGVRVTKR